MFLFIISGLAATGPQFDEYFTDRTMRIDFYFTGTRTQTNFSLDAVYATGPWSGSRTNLLDNPESGQSSDPRL
jgi:hypothetical protein